PCSPTSSPLPYTTLFRSVIISNYHKLAGWADVLAGKVRSVVFDEVQELRIPGTGKYYAARHIAGQADFRLGLSATPIYNYGGEIDRKSTRLNSSHVKISY